VRLTAGVLYHAHDAPDGAVRPSPLAGFVDLTDVAAADTQRYLEALGLGGAYPLLRPGSQRVVARPQGGPPLPAGARVIPATYTISSEHQIGYVLGVSVGF
jgi:hypothetical protein